MGLSEPGEGWTKKRSGKNTSTSWQLAAQSERWPQEGAVFTDTVAHLADPARGGLHGLLFSPLSCLTGTSN